MIIHKFLLAAATYAAANVVLAQVEVVDREVGSFSSPSNTVGAPPIITTTDADYQNTKPSVVVPLSPSANTANNSVTELYYQLQVMQQEVQQLRGLVEQQSHQIKQLKQQRLDDYVDLDRRMSELAGGSAKSTRRTPSARTTNNTGRNTGSSGVQKSSTITATSPSDSKEEIAHYKSATKLILVEKDYTGGIEKLQEHLSLYPKGRYSGNAVYWLGEVYLAQQELEPAKQWFERLLQENPSHTKVPDAKYKLGTVYHRLGDDQKAKALLESVSATSGNAAKLASVYLKDNF